jgi:hypothetical protein
MLEFIPSFISHLLGYYLLRSLFGNPPKLTLKHLLVYVAISVFFNYYLLYYISEIGIWYLLILWIVPMILPILIHLGTLYSPRRMKNRIFATSSTKQMKIAPKVITLLQREKITIILLAAISIILIGLIVLFGNRDVMDWVISGILGFALLFFIFSFIKLSRVDEQKIIVVKGKSIQTVLEYTIDPSKMTINYGTLLNTTTSFVDYIGRVLVTDEDRLHPSWHFLFKTPDETYSSSILRPSDELFYKEVVSKLNYVYDAKITIWKRQNQLIKLKKNK